MLTDFNNASRSKVYRHNENTQSDNLYMSSQHDRVILMAVDMIFWSGNGKIHGDRKGGSALITRLSDNVEKMWNFVGVMEVLRGINHVDMIERIHGDLTG